MATAPTYCTHRQLKDVFPEVDSFDNKRPIYGFNNTDTTNQYQANDTGLITQLYFDGIEGTSVSDSPNADFEFNYSASTDSVQVFHSSTNPNDMLIEAGEDFSTLISRMLANASRFLDAKLDPNLPREQLKDKEGNYDYIIIRTTALIAATFLIRSHDPTSEVAIALMEDAQGNIDALNKGAAALSWQTTGDSSKGIIRDVTYTSGKIRPVDTRGRYYGEWDLVKVVITNAGVLGTATYSVFVKDADKLKATEVVSNRKITGDYQSLTGHLEIRFAGAADSTQAALNDEWEVEVAGWQEEVDNSTINSVRMTRR
mgnify:CR=1 FL=1|tara:strand:+ start:3383 stop:4324 length:942 start_codon:yes stop_codon:yes gene_type:complete